MDKLFLFIALVGDLQVQCVYGSSVAQHSEHRRQGAATIGGSGSGSGSDAGGMAGTNCPTGQIYDWETEQCRAIQCTDYFEQSECESNNCVYDEQNWLCNCRGCPIPCMNIYDETACGERQDCQWDVWSCVAGSTTPGASTTTLPNTDSPSSQGETVAPSVAPTPITTTEIPNPCALRIRREHAETFERVMRQSGCNSGSGDSGGPSGSSASAGIGGGGGENCPTGQTYDWNIQACRETLCHDFFERSDCEGADSSLDCVFDSNDFSCNCRGCPTPCSMIWEENECNNRDDCTYANWQCSSPPPPPTPCGTGAPTASPTSICFGRRIRREDKCVHMSDPTECALVDGCEYHPEHFLCHPVGETIPCDKMFAQSACESNPECKFENFQCFFTYEEVPCNSYELKACPTTRCAKQSESGLCVEASMKDNSRHSEHRRQGAATIGGSGSGSGSDAGGMAGTNCPTGQIYDWETEQCRAIQCTDYFEQSECESNNCVYDEQNWLCNCRGCPIPCMNIYDETACGERQDCQWDVWSCVAGSTTPGASTTTLPNTDSPSRTGETYAPTRSPTTLRQLVCTSDAPTFAPSVLVCETAAPSLLPTVPPTRMPTGRPTTVPTQGPSVPPTPAPTPQPTTQPTAAPSRSPTAAPTPPIDQWFAEFDTISVPRRTWKVPRRQILITALLEYRSNVNLRLGILVEQVQNASSPDTNNLVVGSYSAMLTESNSADPVFCNSPVIHCELEGIAVHCPLRCASVTQAATADVTTTTQTTVAPTDASWCSIIDNCADLGSARSACPVRCPDPSAPNLTLGPDLACCTGDDESSCSFITNPLVNCYNANGDILAETLYSCPRACLACRPCEQVLPSRQGFIYVAYTISADRAESIPNGAVLRARFFLLPRDTIYGYGQAVEIFDPQNGSNAVSLPYNIQVIPGTDAPTQSPATSEPTLSPSSAPTSSRPSASPSTRFPTISPASSQPTTIPSAIPTVRQPTVAPTLSICYEDMRDTWRDSGNLTCQDYVNLQYCHCNGGSGSDCIGDGTYGSGWRSVMGSWSDYATDVNGQRVHAGIACCQCGGGHLGEFTTLSPTPAPTGPCCTLDYLTNGGDAANCDEDIAADESGEHVVCSDPRFASICMIACDTCRVCSTSTTTTDTTVTSTTTRTTTTLTTTTTVTVDPCSFIQCSRECVPNVAGPFQNVSCGWDRESNMCRAGFETQPDEVEFGNCFPLCCERVANLTDLEHPICNSTAITTASCIEPDPRIRTLCPHTCARFNCSVEYCSVRQFIDGSSGTEPPRSVRPTASPATLAPSSGTPSASPTNFPSIPAPRQPVTSCVGILNAELHPCVPERSSECFPATCVDNVCVGVTCESIPQSCVGAQDGSPCQGSNRCMYGTCNAESCFEAPSPDGTPCLSDTAIEGVCLRNSNDHSICDTSGHTTIAPTPRPTSQPTLYPSYEPSEAVTTAQPSMQPSPSPSTTQPSSQPSVSQPTTDPTSNPTSLPSVSPTVSTTQFPISILELANGLTTTGNLLVYSELLIEGLSTYSVLSNRNNQLKIMDAISASLAEQGIKGVDIHLTHAASVSKRSDNPTTSGVYIEYAVFLSTSTVDEKTQLEEVMQSKSPLKLFTLQIQTRLRDSDLSGIANSAEITVAVSDSPISQFVGADGTAVTSTSTGEDDDGSLSGTSVALIVLLVLALLCVSIYGLSVWFRGSGQGQYEVAKAKLKGAKDKIKELFGRNKSNDIHVITNEAGPQ